MQQGLHERRPESMMAGMATALALHGLDSGTVERMAQKYATTGREITEVELSTTFGCAIVTIKNIVTDPRFVALVNHKVEILLHRDGRRAAIDLLLAVARDATAALGHRLRAVELILSRTMPAAQAAPDAGPDRDLTDLSADELRVLVDGMQSELAQRATPVNAPDNAPIVIDATPINPNSCFD